MEVQRSGKPNTATHFKDTKHANVRWLKLFRPAHVAQTGVLGIRKDELEQASSREQESKDSLNDRGCRTHLQTPARSDRLVSGMRRSLRPHTFLCVPSVTVGVIHCAAQRSGRLLWLAAPACSWPRSLSTSER